jgi:hypothetical protein
MSEKTARRLLVTGHDAQGRSCVASDSIITGDEIPGRGGMEITQVWGADGVMRYPDSGAKPAYTNFFPPMGGFRMIDMYMPGKTFNEEIGADEADGMEEMIAGHAATLDKSRPGMHRSATIDMGVIVAGRVVLQLDTGEVTLKEGDVLVQSGTMHAWYNPFDEPCRLIGVSVAAEIEGD